MKKILVGLSIAASLTILIPTKQAFAASEAECAIWLCLPIGFPSGCSEAKKAFKKRIKKLKSPLPALTSCLSTDVHTTNSSGQQTNAAYDYGNVASYSDVKVCEIFNGKNNCQSNKVKGGVCPPRTTQGGGCTNAHYIDIFFDGKKVGDTYYW